MILVFPIVGIRIIKRAPEFFYDRVLVIGAITFVLAVLWSWYFEVYKDRDLSKGISSQVSRKFSALSEKITNDKNTALKLILVLFIVFMILPVFTSMYQTTVYSLAFLYVMLALGLNIVVGIAGQLVLGYAAFYAVGAYTYALLNQYLGLGFWTCLPIAGFITVIAGLLLAFPVLRLRGDYLAIVTLGFGEIVRLLLINWANFTGGNRGIANIPRPGLFGLELSPEASTIYIYYLCLFAAIITIIIVARLINSRVGLALQALREDEIASEAMGIDLRKIKLSAFALGSCWAGFAGVLFAARNSYINPTSFTFMDSAMILSMVVLGGMGSIVGVALAALVLTLLPEYLRAFSEYRMLIFGLLMVTMMVFRPQGIIPPAKRKYYPTALQNEENS
ncbi:branched-chain amino acid ABC transporter permease [Taurinivorans muris]|uniref:Branched-chain amino acid ABC transporter permease n=2 Tax=Taurinivorans muris TaxID=2787751 RepID=A0ABY5Y544_9BACT|nr:branched-chain amino acid ABC transporter permease [Desulfovibrionaceae bacterium LT0009]